MNESANWVATGENWCDEAIYRTKWRYCLVVTEDEYYHECAKLGVSRDQWGSPTGGGPACVTFFKPPITADKVMIVCILGWESHSGIQIAGLLLHEAVHVFQHICQDIGETHPSDEFQAYGIQTIAENLLEKFWSRVIWPISPENPANQEKV